MRAYTYITNWQWVHNHLGCACSSLVARSDERDRLGDHRLGDEHLGADAVGERGVTMARAFNLREGLTRDDDRLPMRMQHVSRERAGQRGAGRPRSARRGQVTFYGMMGWDPQTGGPTRAKLQELDIAWVYDQLK